MNSNPDDLLERYLQAIGQFLPATAREDTLAELRANLLEQMDARAEELNRPLAEADVATILRSHGRPEVVAARYLPQRSLIGPALFPVYLFALRRALPLVVAIYAIAKGAALIASPASPFGVTDVLAAIANVVPTLLIFWSTVTIVFAAIEIIQARRSVSSKNASDSAWDPAKLPAVKSEQGLTKRRSLTSRIADLVVHCFWMLYCLAIPAHPFLLIGPGADYLKTHGIRFAPMWHTFFVLLVALLLVQLIMKVIAIANQYQALLRPLQVVTNLLSLAATGIMAAAAEYFVPATSSANLVSLAQVNHGMTIAFRIAFIFALIGLLVDSWKAVKRHVPTQGLAF